ncbi:MAG: histidine phosphatase family protein, partial [Pyrinomonadaceae bacterium]
FRLVLIRHGEPEAASRGKCYGKLDVKLSKRGRREIVRAAKWLESIHKNGAPIDRIYTSSRARTKESAQILADRLGLRSGIIVDQRLSEMNFGEFEGLTYAQVSERYPDEYRLWMECPTEVHFPGGESFKVMQARVKDAVNEICAYAISTTAVIIAHGGVSRIVLSDVLRMPAEALFRLDQGYASINIIDYFGVTPLVRLVNMTV